MIFDNLLDIDDLDLEKKMEQIAEKDRQLNFQIFQLLPLILPEEKLALAAISIYFIDQTESQIINITPKEEAFSDGLKQAIQLTQQLSPGSKAELASAILAEIFDTEELVLDPPSTTLE